MADEQTLAEKCVVLCPLVSLGLTHSNYPYTDANFIFRITLNINQKIDLWVEIKMAQRNYLEECCPMELSAAMAMFSIYTVWYGSH